MASATIRSARCSCAGLAGAQTKDTATACTPSRLKTSMAARTSSSFSGWRTEPSASTRSRTGRRSRRGTSCGAGG